jgi:excinuclease ABC subunit A
MIQSLAAHYKFDIEMPFDELSEDLRQIILFGSGKEKIDFQYANSRGLQIKQSHRFEGVIPSRTRRTEPFPQQPAMSGV